MFYSDDANRRQPLRHRGGGGGMFYRALLAPFDANLSSFGGLGPSGAEILPNLPRCCWQQGAYGAKLVRTVPYPLARVVRTIL